MYGSHPLRDFYAERRERVRESGAGERRDGDQRGAARVVGFIQDAIVAVLIEAAE